MTVNGLTATATYSFDGVNRVVSSSSPLGRTALATLDGKGRVVQASVPEVAPVNYQYDTRGRLLTVSQTGDGQTRTVGLTYDTTQNGGAASGRLTGITDVLGNTTTFTYDPGLSGRVVRETFANGRYLQYQYDANGNLTGVTPPQKPQHLFAFDAVDLLAQYTPPSAPDTGNDFTSYAYNLNKQITTVTRPDGLQINCAYDPGIGWLTNVSLPLGESVAYAYVQNGCGCSGVGRPQSLTFHAVDYTSAINYTYDSSLVTGVAWSGPVAGTVNAGYDNFFRVNALSVNGGSAVGFGYDADGLLVQAGDLALTRDPQNGRLAGTTLGNVSDAWAYTGFGEAQSYTATAGGNVLYAMSFTRDSAGRIATRTETIGGVTSVYGYGYDPVRGWLTDVTKNGVAAGHYAYDDNGNRTSVVTADRAVDYAAADGQDRITSATLTLPLQVPQTVSWTYSANGEVQSRSVGASTTSYSYDVQGTLRDVTLAGGVRIAYVVDAAGRRIGKAVNGSLTRGWLYQDGLKPAAELDGAGNVVSLFVYGGKANVPEYLVRGGTEYRLITDQLGSVRLVVNAVDGTVAQELDYDEFGRVLNDSNPGFQPFGFAGGLYDPDTKLVRFGARDYDAASGRWMSKDPIGFNGGNNWYAYVGNDPINYIDPYGLKTVFVPPGMQGPPAPGDTWVYPPPIPPSVSVYGNMSLAQQTGFGSLNGTAVALNTGMSGGMSYVGTALDTAAWFYNRVKTCGPWDYKNGPYPNASQYDPFGNFNFGAAGTAYGWDPLTLQNEAGIANGPGGEGQPGPHLAPERGIPPYGDRPQDNWWIRMGIEYANQYPVAKGPGPWK